MQHKDNDHLRDILNKKFTLDDDNEDENKKEIEEELPEKIGRFNVIRKVGQGGMAKVFKVKEKFTNTDLALKISLSNTEIAKKKFLYEARIMRLLGSHKNILLTKAVEYTNDGIPYYTMPYINSPSLSFILKNNIRTIETTYGIKAPAVYRKIKRKGYNIEKLKLAIVLAKTVNYINSCGIVHRDLKPDNILIDENGNLFVFDFGLALNINKNNSFLNDETIINNNQIVGTPVYMSPEQVSGKTLNAKSDQFTVAAIIYQIFCSSEKSPFWGANLAKVKENILNELELLSELKGLGNFSEKLAYIIDKALSLDTKERYDNLLDLAIDLENYSEDLPLYGIHESLFDKAKRFNRREPVASIIILLIFVTTIIASTVFYFLTVSYNKAKEKKEENLLKLMITENIELAEAAKKDNKARKAFEAKAESMQSSYYGYSRELVNKRYKSLKKSLEKYKTKNGYSQLGHLLFREARYLIKNEDFKLKALKINRFSRKKR